MARCPIIGGGVVHRKIASNMYFASFITCSIGFMFLFPPHACFRSTAVQNPLILLPSRRLPEAPLNARTPTRANLFCTPPRLVSSHKSFSFGHKPNVTPRSSTERFFIPSWFVWKDAVVYIGFKSFVGESVGFFLGLSASLPWGETGSIPRLQLKFQPIYHFITIFYINLTYSFKCHVKVLPYLDEALSQFFKINARDHWCEGFTKFDVDDGICFTRLSMHNCSTFIVCSSTLWMFIHLGQIPSRKCGKIKCNNRSLMDSVCQMQEKRVCIAS